MRVILRRSRRISPERSFATLRMRIKIRENSFSKISFCIPLYCTVFLLCRVPPRGRGEARRMGFRACRRAQGRQARARLAAERGVAKKARAAAQIALRA